MLRKDLMTALQKEKAALRMAIEVGCPMFEVLCRLALAEILAECGDERKCVANLQTLRSIAQGIDNRHLEFTGLVVFAQIALGHGHERTGLAALRRGLELDASTVTAISSGGGPLRLRACSSMRSKKASSPSTRRA